MLLLAGLAGLGIVNPMTCFAQDSEVKAEVDHESDVHEGEAGHEEAHGSEASHGDESHGDESHGDGSHDDTHAAGHDGEHAEHGDAHGGGNSNPLSVDPDLAIFTAIIFLLMLAILRKFAWGPIRDGLAAREKGIADQIAEAHRSNEEARRLLAEHEAKVSSASNEVKEMLDQAKREAEEKKSEILAEAEAAAKSEKDRAVREIHAAKNNALEDLAKTSVDQAVGLAGRIMGKELQDGNHTDLIQEALKKFPSEN
jgi:F-type H+-transporting ATPase subunit b